MGKSCVAISSLATSNQVLDNFLQCLPNHVEPSKPILEAIYTPNNSSFQSVLQAYIKNRRFLTPSTTKPLAIVTALHESHVQATVVCAKYHGMQLRIRSGGHDFEGLSYMSDVPFVILDMFNLRSIDIDIASETAWVQAGAILGELYYKIAKKSKVHAFPAGICLTLGAGGHFSGGGYGTMMRKYGLSVDHIIDAQIVDVNGNILDRKSMGEDLFWAIRGGGGASFGVILSWKIKLVRVPAKVTIFSVQRTLEQGATGIVYKWQQVAKKIDKELFIRAQPEVQNPRNATEKKTVRVTFIGQFLGQTSKLLTLMNKKFPELGLKQEDCKQVSWLQSTMFWTNLPIESPPEVLLNRTIPAELFFKSKSDYVKDVISKKDLEKIWKMFLKTEGMVMQWNLYGGRMSEIPDTSTPFPHRAGYLFKIQYFTLWFQEGTEASNRHISLAREMYDSMAPYVSKDPREAFLNYRDLDIGSNPSNLTNFEEAEVYGHKYFRNNFRRLTEVKKRVDPDNFFKNEQSIPPLPAAAS
ncbi:Reticuline oxidase precursor, putative [Ricinus communis]|uniref:Reticuline oxidase, putative n=1 Tax=Ricinus communis TaxID=3988 RepID=B9SV72_RICCO|nr:Reticuline oxidase precursor, putative [Ricinus communis]